MTSIDSTVRVGTGALPGRFRRPLAWSKLEVGRYVDRTDRYRIYRDQGTWVLSCRDSLVRNYGTLRSAKLAAKWQEERGEPVHLEPLPPISQGGIVRGESGWIVVSRT